MKHLSILATIAVAMASAAQSPALAKSVKLHDSKINCMATLRENLPSFHRGSTESGFQPQIAIAEAAYDYASTPAAGDASRKVTNDAVSCLRAYYSARAYRQHQFLGAGTWITRLGVLGVALSSGASVATQNFWGAGAVAPVLVSSSEGYEPTRLLYEGGGAGVDVLQARYTNITRMVAAFPSDWTALGKASEDLQKACLKINGVSKNVRDWDSSLVGIETGAQSLSATCQKAQASYATLQVNVAALTRTGQALDQSFAQDLGRLNEQVLQRDRQISPTPFQTLTRFAAAPFLTVGATLVGSTPTIAAGLGEAGPLSDMDVPITTLEIWSLPAQLPEDVTVPQSVIDAEKNWRTTVYQAQMTNLEAAKKKADAAVADQNKAKKALAAKPNEQALQAALDQKDDLVSSTKAAVDDLQRVKLTDPKTVNDQVDILSDAIGPINAYAVLANAATTRFTHLQGEARLNTLQIRVGNSGHEAVAQLAYIPAGATPTPAATAPATPPVPAPAGAGK
jgi:hypothetical protein